ncbi:MAG: hypothetical protein IGS48_05755 [Oscillatoriales cyanobacterium C42_A2020_001]|nr:hypothetical protein [Leptolyngbyaceae cyanobacterium C42_A2020_001]
MNIAYIISAYKYPQQLARLVYRLNTNSVSFFIHVDRKTNNQIFDEMRHLLKDFSNVYFLDRHACYWGDFGHVEATLKGLRAISNYGIKYDYVFLLTGQCYPIKSNSKIVDFLSQSNGLSYMSYYPVGASWMKRIDRWHFRLFARYYLTFPNKFLPLHLRRPLASKFEPYYRGSSYWCLHRNCIEYILDFLNNDDATYRGRFLNFFKGVYIPDEFFFHTILLNSPLKQDIINNDLWYIQWPPGSYVPSPRILNQFDFDDLMNCDQLFARKFDPLQDSQILEMIDTATEKSDLHTKFST